MFDELKNEVGHLLVRRVIKRDDWTSEAIFNIAAGSKPTWTPEEWATLTHDLEKSQLRVSKWLETNEDE